MWKRRWFLALWLLTIGCNTFLPEIPESNSLLEGELAGLTETQNAIFLRGDEAFNEVFTPAKGLGPVFVANSCATCHPGDGKGHPANALTRFGRMNGLQFDPMVEFGGPQLQHRAIPGYVGETVPPEATGVTKLVAPANTGLGFIEAITDLQILNWADPDDLDGDGISGRPNWVVPPDFFIPGPDQVSQNGLYIGRFGKKAAALNLTQQTVNAYKQDIGITSDFDTEDIFNPALGYQTVDNVPDPEVSSATVLDVVFYLRTLKAPERRNAESSEILEGENLFADIGCESCHRANITTGPSEISQLAFKLINPYTDLLLHDMGPGLDDGFTEGSATTSEWRTPPLWGLGLAGSAQGGKMFLMHDGRARSIEEAILLHGGEAEKSKNNFSELNAESRNKIIAFLRSL